ncbi:uncharacterized protein N7482_009932 [Penicillium canariense]|uniref:Mitochondrial inner membrane protease subunit n=1 Tax=Penicillium canariense TaxID=189055 RepID=A0A9W9HRC0_9EURO|nr:uncharacterized protein N7482_009932 [Penicillium canariense]KAJ5153454.1 hypothetical protein N7482_009932 [Penicillium canariense]
MPHHDRKAPGSNLRALNPTEAKTLSRSGKLPPKKAPAPPLEPVPAPAPVPETPGPSLARKGPFQSFFSNFRQRYAALPRPVRLMCRGARVLVPLIPISLFFSEHVMQIMWVKGPSMTPYLNEDYDQMHTKSDMVLVNMWSLHRILPWKRQTRLERGMVVTFRSPANSSHIAIKRVVGLPGDRITTREPCLKSTQIVPFNHVWLEGDAADPRRSLDSNTYGPVSISLITGRVVGVLGPRMRWLDWTQWESGKVEDAGLDSRLGENYRQSVRDRVLKEAVKLERPADF